MGLVPELVAVHGAFGLWKLKAGGSTFREYLKEEKS